MKDLFNLKAFLGFVIISTGLFSCSTNIFSSCKENYTFYGNYLLTFYIIDQTGENLIEIGRNRYNRDTVDILDENWNSLGFHPYQNGSIVFGFMEHLRGIEEPLNTPINHTYYIYFEEGDYDTLDISYQIGLDQCDERELTQWGVSYNDSLYFNYPTNPRQHGGAFFVKKVSGK